MERPWDELAPDVIAAINSPSLEESCFGEVLKLETPSMHVKKKKLIKISFTFLMAIYTFLSICLLLGFD